MRIERPLFTGNYKSGYIGFTYHDNSFISKGIVYFTSPPTRKIRVSHVFIVKDKNFGYESTMNKKVNGIHCFNLNKYFNDDNCHVIFKKPFDLKKSDVETMLFYAIKNEGKRYDYPLLIGFVLRWILRPIENSPWLRENPSIFNSKDKWICSEFVAFLLKQIPKYVVSWPLSHYHSSKISPQLLFDSRELWQKWRYRNEKNNNSLA